MSPFSQEAGRKLLKDCGNLVPTPGGRNELQGPGRGCRETEVGPRVCQGFFGSSSPASCMGRQWNRRRGYLRTAFSLFHVCLSLPLSLSHTHSHMLRNRALDCESEALRKEEFACSFIRSIASSLPGKGTEVSGPVLPTQAGRGRTLCIHSLHKWASPVALRLEIKSFASRGLLTKGERNNSHTSKCVM